MVLRFSKADRSLSCIEPLGDFGRIFLTRRMEEFCTYVKNQEGRNNFLWKGSRTLHFLMLLVKTPINTGSMLLSPLSSSTCFLLIAGGNLYDKILRQKDKLFEEEVIHLCGRKLELCLILAFWFCIYSFNNEECFSPFVQTPSRL